MYLSNSEEGHWIQPYDALMTCEGGTYYLRGSSAQLCLSNGRKTFRVSPDDYFGLRRNELLCIKYVKKILIKMLIY